MACSQIVLNYGVSAPLCGRSTSGVRVRDEFPDLSSSWNVVYFLDVEVASDH